MPRIRPYPEKVLKRQSRKYVEKQNWSRGFVSGLKVLNAADHC